MRQGKDHVIIRNREQLTHTSHDPLQASTTLALGTMAVTAGVIGLVNITALITLFSMAAQRFGAALPNGANDFMLQRRDFMAGKKRCSVAIEDICQFVAGLLVGSVGRTSYGIVTSMGV